MQVVLAILLIATSTVGLAVGIRLLSLWRRSRAIPELAIGSAALFTCTAGISRVVLLRLPEDAAPELAVILELIFLVLFVASPIGMALGTWRVFRPDARWAAVFATCLIVALFLSLPARYLIPGAGALDSPRAVIMLGLIVVTSGWTAIEAWLHHHKLKLRMRIGLGDPVSAGQFMSWGFGMSCDTGMRSLTLCFAALGIEPMQSVFFVPAAMTLGFLTLAGLYAAFFPPLAYQAWLRGDADSGAAEVGG